MPDSLAGDLDAECSACLMGAQRLGELFDRYGRAQVEACFDAILDRTTETFRRELLSKIPDGTYVWEDYAEHDGVDPPRLHAQRITLTVDQSADDALVIDFAGTSPQAKGPINHAGNYADGVFLKKWLAPILRNLADSPERDGRARRQRGRRAAHRAALPDRRAPCSRRSSRRRSTRARSSSCGCSASSPASWPRRPAAACPPTRRRSATPASTATDAEGGPYLMREVLGGGSGGRH